MDLNRLLTDLGCPGVIDVLSPSWDDSVASLPERPRLLQPEAIAWARQFGGLPDDVEPLLLEMAARVTASPELSLLLWHLSRLLYELPDYAGPQCARWPELEPALGERWGLFYLLLALDVLPRMLAKHRELGVPEAVSNQCMRIFPEGVRLFGLSRGGKLGFPPRTLYWLRNHNAGILFTLGRLEYMLKPFSPRVRVYRHADGRVLALSSPDLNYSAAGFLESYEPTAFTSVLEETDQTVRGNPLDPTTGRALPRPVTLDLAVWRPALLPGDLIYEIHIPAGGNMTLENCLDSMRQAAAFFPRYFPDRPARGFSCHSWILDPEIEHWYTPTSNMVAWQRELYLVPCPTGGRDGLYFMFGEAPVEPATSPRDTSLKRAALDHLAAGGRIRAGGMFVLLEDLDALGTQPSRAMYATGEVGGVG